MLVLSRKPGEAIQISGFNFVVKVGVVRMNKADVRLSIEADKSVNIMRTELLPTGNQEAPETHNNCRHCRHGGTFHDADCPVLIARSLINSAIRQMELHSRAKQQAYMDSHSVESKPSEYSSSGQRYFNAGWESAGAFLKDVLSEQVPA